ncbi:hypothetical protein PGIGA_G00229940 [Pangasianodon gigas]|uniref:Uncharacterized protein n=1 Tax=Pangasianodon gigas TaxID=30993 RepID=A0ACC5WL45_PANGG|nr:hypothetical protein [Pangasianodon gigas]
MKLSVLLICAVLCVLQTATAQVKFGQLCSGNSANTKRGCDSSKYGCGHYGASRSGGTRKHEGLDIVCADGATVYAPFDVKLNRKAVPYKQNNAINDGIELSGQGQKLGTLLPMQKVYPGITSHIHVQMCDKSDPTKYF